MIAPWPWSLLHALQLAGDETERAFPGDRHELFAAAALAASPGHL